VVLPAGRARKEWRRPSNWGRTSVRPEWGNAGPMPGSLPAEKVQVNLIDIRQKYFTTWPRNTESLFNPSTMNILCLAALKDNLPPELLKNISFGLLVIIAVAGVFCIIKCVQGADMLDRGEDGKKKIYSGIAIAWRRGSPSPLSRPRTWRTCWVSQIFKSLGKPPRNC